MIVVKLPVKPQAGKAGYVQPVDGSGSINCEEVYDEKKHVKYASYELKKVNPKIYLLKRTNLSLTMLSVNLSRKLIVASQDLVIGYRKGKINHMVISPYRTYHHCQ